MKARATHSIVPPCRFLDDAVFATKTGETGIVLKLYPHDSECMESADKVATARRFEAAMRLVLPSSRVYQYLIKRLLCSVSGDRARAGYLESKTLYSFENYLVILRSDLESGELRKTAESVVVQLGSVIPAEIQGKRSAFAFLRKLMNYDPAVSSMVEWHEGRPYIDYYCSDSSIEVHRSNLIVGDYFANVMTLKDPPITTDVDMIRDLREIPCECIIVSEWCPQDLDVIRSLIKAKTSHFHLAKKVTHLGYGLVEMFGRILGSRSEQKERLEDQQEDASVDAMEAQLGDLITDIEKNGTQVGEYALTVILFGRDQKFVEKAAAEAFKAASGKEMILSGERHNLLFSWASCIPGNYRHQRRAMYMTNRNYADLAMLFAPDTGNERNEHLNAECLAVLETRQRTPYYGSLHFQDVGHALFIGMTGSGKSYICSYLLSCALWKYKPRILIFDIGGSYKKLTANAGGSYLEIGLRHDFTINPFSLPDTEENRHFLFSFVKVLIESGQHRMDDVEQDELYRAIPDTRRLRDLSEKLPEDLRPFLSRWIGHGQYARIFDNEAETLTCARFQTYDFEGLEKFPQILEPLLFYILHRANAEIYDNSARSEFKIFLLDEAWRFLMNETVRQYIYESLKTWRKRNAAMWLATQSMGDLAKSEMLATVAENCGSIVLLPNPRMNREEYRQVFKLNNRELDEVLAMQPKRESLWKVGTEVGKVLILDAGAESGNSQAAVA